MKHLSLLATLMLSSSMVYAGDWTYHDFNSDTKMYNPVPKYSCLEMICEYGCVENIKTGNGECCPAPTLENCLTTQFDEKGCPIAKKIECSGNTPICLTDGKCISEINNLSSCINNTQCPIGERCNTKTKTCQPCPEPTKFSCAIAKDTVSANCVTVKKVDCATESPETPICFTGKFDNTKLTKEASQRNLTGLCVECAKDEDCSTGYCNPETLTCQSCPINQPNRIGQNCTKACGCDNGLSCIFQEETICGYKGVCQQTCESNSDCNKNEYCSFENNEGQCKKGYGLCKSNRDKISKNGYLVSKEPMTWWSAQNWCASHNKDLIDYDFDCFSTSGSPTSIIYASENPLDNIQGNHRGYCCKSGKNPSTTNGCLKNTGTNMPQKMRELRNNLNGALSSKDSCFWTNYQTNSCYAYTVGFKANQIWNTPLTGLYTLESGEPNHMHALCQ